MYESGGMRRVHLKGRENILKRLLRTGADRGAGEPNTWKEVVQAVASRSERRVAVQEYGRPNPEMTTALEALGAQVMPLSEAHATRSDATARSGVRTLPSSSASKARAEEGAGGFREASRRCLMLPSRRSPLNPSLPPERHGSKARRRSRHRWRSWFEGRPDPEPAARCRRARRGLRTVPGDAIRSRNSSDPASAGLEENGGAGPREHSRPEGRAVPPPSS